MADMSQSKPDLSPVKRALFEIRTLRARVGELEQAVRQPVAIIGVGLRFPGGIVDEDSLWKLLSSGSDASREIPRERWDYRAYYDRNPEVPGAMYTERGGFLEDVDRFDAPLFGISPREAVGMDPQHRLVLEVGWEALENAGYSAAALLSSPTGVFLGIGNSDYGRRALADLDHIDAYTGSGNSPAMVAGRLSYALGLHGPSLAIDTSCSSSLVAVHAACASLRAGECDMALAGGVNLILSPEVNVALSKAHMMAPDGHCKTFDEAADGYVRSEGCCIVVLKKLTDAIADRDRILAVIRGSAVNHDGRSGGLTAPSGPAQAAVIRKAFERAGIDPAQVDYVEAHGTGTSLGDPIEVDTLASVVGKGRPAAGPAMLGSIKTNIGHTEAASGIAGLMKAVQVLQHRTVPPHLHLNRRSPHIDWDHIPLTVPTQSVALSSPGRSLYASVSSFGFSGTNAHLVLEQAPALPQTANAYVRKPHVLALSARTQAGLDALRAKYAIFLRTATADIADVCFTANTGRNHFDCRIAAMGETAGQIAAALETGAGAAVCKSGTAKSESPAGICFLYTGQGSQYVGMGEELYASSPVYREAVDRCAVAWKEQTGESLLEVLRGPAEGLKRAQQAQPALFAVEYGLSELWRSWGVEPSLLLGHSLGEYVAAVVAGVFSLEDGLRLVRARAELMDSLSGRGVKRGGMRAVQGSAERVRGLLTGEESEVGIAAINGPESVVLSGAEERLEELNRRLEGEGLRTRGLEVTHAFHSPLLEPILEEFERRAEEVRYSAPRLRMVSNVTGGLAGEKEMCHAGYWRKHMRSTVQFYAGMQAALASGCTTFLEIGPQPHLLTLGKLSDQRPELLWLPSIRKGRNPWIDLLGTARLLYEDGAEIDWKGVHGQSGRKISLPTYPFQRHRYPVPKAAATVSELIPEEQTQHPLLGARVNSPLDDEQFEARIGPERPAYLAHHSVHGKPIVPAAAYLEIALSAAGALGLEHAAIRSAAFLQPCVFDVPRRLQCILKKNGSGRAFSIYSSGADGTNPEWLLHATGELTAVSSSDDTGRVDFAELRNRCVHKLDTAEFYRVFETYGLTFGPAFRPLAQILQGTREALVRFAVPDAAGDDSDAYAIHPVALDACVQAVAAAVMASADSNAALQLPSGIEELTVAGDCSSMTMAHAVLRDGEDGKMRADFRGFDRDGKLLLEARGLTLRAMQLPRAGFLHESSYELEWCALSSEAKSLEIAGNWAIVGLEPLASEFSALLQAQGVSCGLVYQDEAAAHPDGYRIALRRIGSHAPLTDIMYVAPPPHAELARNLAAPESRALRECLRLMQAALSVNGAAPSRFWIVTRGGQGPALTDLSQAMLWGFGRAASLEHPEMRTIRVDLDTTREPEATQLLRVVRSAGIEDELVLREGSLMAPRLRKLCMQPDGALPATQSNVHLALTQAGTIDGLQLLPASRREPSPGELEIEIRAACLNFRDVLNVLGMYKGKPGPIGGECAGIVTQVGPGVDSFRPGDEVIALGRGCFGRFMTTQEKLVWRKPPRLSFTAAVTIPIAFLTAEFSLRQIARLQPGESVLIHAGAGGVGLAAVQIAQKAGAVVFATAGSEEKRGYLRSLGVDTVMDSRSVEFAKELQEATGGRGVDVVLNSLAGLFIDAGIRSLAPGGRFIELGVADLRSAESVRAMRADVSYITVDLASEIEAGSALVQTTIGALIEQFERGLLTPLPRELFTLEDAHNAFRYMAQARHIGRVVLTPQVAAPVEIRRDSAYLITGGMSGVGLKIAASLGEQGAGEVIVMGRRKPSSEAEGVFNAMHAAGTAVTVRLGDVAKEQDVAAALQAGLPLRGIFHCAGNLEDGALLQQTWDRFEDVLSAKVQGAWHLHCLTRNSPLDCFVLFSSIAGIFGSPGQSNYASANAFLDALAQFRRAHNMPGLSIDWGAWAETGMAARHHVVERSSATGLMGIATKDGIDAMYTLLRRGTGSQIMVAPVDWSRYLANELPAGHRNVLSGLGKSGNLRPDSAGAPAKRESWLPRLHAVARHHWKKLLAGLIEERIRQTLQLDRAQPVPPEQPLQELGLDSLLSIELRNALGQAVDRSLPATLLFNYPTLDALTAFLVHEIGGEAAPDSATRIAPKPDRRRLLDDIEALSDAEVDRMLGEKAARGAV